MIVFKSLAVAWRWLGFPQQRSELIQLRMFLQGSTLAFEDFSHLLSVTLSSLWCPSVTEPTGIVILESSEPISVYFYQNIFQEEEGCGHAFHQDPIQNPQQGEEIKQPKNYELVFSKNRSIFRAVQQWTWVLTGLSRQRDSGDFRCDWEPFRQSWAISAATGKAVLRTAKESHWGLLYVFPFCFQRITFTKHYSSEEKCYVI